MKNFFINLLGGYTSEEVVRISKEHTKEKEKLITQLRELHHRVNYRRPKNHR